MLLLSREVIYSFRSKTNNRAPKSKIHTDDHDPCYQKYPKTTNHIFWRSLMQASSG